jgi:hypothetical protein
LLGAGLLTILTAGSATPLLVLAAGALATAGGTAITTTSLILLAASYKGATTAKQDREITQTLHTVGPLSSPLGLPFGAAGTMIADNPMQGLRNGALIGNIAELGIGVGRFGIARWSSGTARELSNDAALIAGTALLKPTVPRGFSVLGSHGAPGVYQTASGAIAHISNLAPMIQGGSQGRVMLLMCEVARDPAAVQALSNSTGRSITAFTEGVNGANFNQIWAYVNGVRSHLATPVVFKPQYLSPYLSPIPNMAAPGAAAISGK